MDNITVLFAQVVNGREEILNTSFFADSRAFGYDRKITAKQKYDLFHAYSLEARPPRPSTGSVTMLFITERIHIDQ